MRAALLSFPLVLLGCVDDTPETLTVVVDANRARAQADQAKLAEMQRAVDEARQELLRTREDLTVLREKLVAAGAVVRRSLLFSNVRVEANSLLEDAVVLPLTVSSMSGEEGESPWAELPFRVPPSDHGDPTRKVPTPTA